MKQLAWLLLTVPVAFACEGSGSVGDRAVTRCVPEGACPESMFKSGITADMGHAEAGAVIYQKSCAECHGTDGRGIKEAKRVDMTSAVWQARFRDGQITFTVRTGRPPVMPAFRLADQELRDLLAYVRSLVKAPPPTEIKGY